MKDETVIFFGNRDLGLRILRHLISVGDVPRAVFLHPKGTSQWTDQLWELAESIDAVVLEADELDGNEALNTVASLQPTIGVSAYFGHILKAEMLALFPRGILNFHGSLLPWNRGRDPNVWAIYEGTPAGGTIHLMDEGVDTGPILVQREVIVTPDMNAADLYHLTVDALVSLGEEHWPLLRKGRIKARSQGNGTTHRRLEFERLKQLDLTKEMTVRDAINLLRACAVDRIVAAEFSEGGTRYSVRVNTTVVPRNGAKE